MCVHVCVRWCVRFNLSETSSPGLKIPHTSHLEGGNLPFGVKPTCDRLSGCQAE